MRDFPNVFGDFEKMALQKTFRCVDRIANVASHFIMQNKAQIPKDVVAANAASAPAVHVKFYSGPSELALNEVIGAIARGVESGASASVLLLGRYRHHKPRSLTYMRELRPNLRIDFKTVHGAKGLEADYVVLLDVQSGKYGFPSEIIDDPLLELVLAAPEPYPNAEERRLLYVGFTRARREVFLLADATRRSAFVSELLAASKDVTILGNTAIHAVMCPVCSSGRLVKKSGPKSSFFACSNWPYCEHKQPTCTCGEGPPIRS